MKEEFETLDLAYILRLLKRRIIWIILAILIGGSLLFFYARFFVAPQYTSEISFYVNSKQVEGNPSVGNRTEEITNQQIAAAQQLIQTYSVILKHPAVTVDVAEKMGNKYSSGQIASMINVSSFDGSMIMHVSVTAGDPKEAQDICNYLDELGTVKIEEITKTGYIRSVGPATAPSAPSSPNVQRYAMIGAVIGLVIACAVIIIAGLLDNTIKSAEELKERFDVPILGKIPSLESISGGRKGY